mmetsp:Transcript_113466/g.177401  ORF Transcript_113466/g.177401 Transcript_113466/m.177401 type:complete len:560 (+) Transcript_113466:110-1789(+)
MSSEVMTVQPEEHFARDDLPKGNSSVLDLARRIETNARVNAQNQRNGCVTSSPRGQTAPASPRIFVRSGSQPLVRSPRREAQENAERLKAANSEREKVYLVLREENQRLKEENNALRTQLSVEAMAAESPSPVAPADHSEGRLRAALTKKGVTPSELRQAIRGVEAMLDEAKRELRNAELREQRAAMEALHHAIDKDDEVELELAIERGRLADISDVDITKGEDKLRELRSMTVEQKAAKLARELESKAKKDAFLLIKKDDTEALKVLLDGLDPSVRWKDWRDYAGRTLWKCAQDLRARQQLEFLAPLFGQKLPEDPSRRRGTVEISSSAEARPMRPSVSSLPRQSLSSVGESGRMSAVSSNSGKDAIASRQVSLEDEPSGDGQLSFPSSPQGPNKWDLAREDTVNPDSVSCCMSPSLSPSKFYDDGDPETAELRQKALRAVAQDDIYMLEEVLNVVHKDVWEKWQNKAGKDLLTLSQERGSNSAYSLLARSKGILKELQREAFEEREAVWVFENGEVQPRRATVLEESPPEEDTVYVEFWDGDEEPVRVERCLVRKIN